MTTIYGTYEICFYAIHTRILIIDYHGLAYITYGLNDHEPSYDLFQNLISYGFKKSMKKYYKYVIKPKEEN
jgi:hypothetical protein